jgi:hypothetical protein
MSERLIDATSILHYELEAPPEVCNPSAHCEGISGRQPHNLSTLLLLAAPTRSAHGRAGATGSVRHKRVSCNSDTPTGDYLIENNICVETRKPFAISYRAAHVFGPASNSTITNNWDQDLQRRKRFTAETSDEYRFNNTPLFVNDH